MSVSAFRELHRLNRLALAQICQFLVIGATASRGHVLLAWINTLVGCINSAHGTASKNEKTNDTRRLQEQYQRRETYWRKRDTPSPQTEWLSGGRDGLAQDQMTDQITNRIDEHAWVNNTNNERDKSYLASSTDKLRDNQVLQSVLCMKTFVSIYTGWR
jgi:hypothetical protein